MSCVLCSSLNEAEFATEMMIHVNGPQRLTSTSVLAFPKILVCLDCGSSHFNTPGAELRALRKGSRSR